MGSKRDNRPRVADAVGTALLATGIGALVWLDQTQGTLREAVVPTTIAWFAVAFVGFVVLLSMQQRRGPSIDWRFFLALGLGLRMVLLLTEPTLSDDVYRYLWEGHLITEGVSPHAFAIDSALGDQYDIPARALSNNTSLASPYLPTAHAIFGASALVLPAEPWTMQLLMIGFETLGLWMMIRLLHAADLPRHRSLIYWLNPLVIIEVAHGAHLDAIIVGLSGLGLWLTLVRGRTNSTAARLAPFVVAAATLSRPLAALLVPVLFWIWSWRDRVSYAVGIVVPVGLAGAWAGFGLTNDDGTGVFGSARAYTETFRFNSGIYHWTERWISGRGLDDRGWNEPIALTRLVIAGLVLAALLWLFLRARHIWANPNEVRSQAQETRGALRLLVFPMALYVLVAPVLHPWYVLLLLALLPFAAPSSDESAARWLDLVPWLCLSGLLIFSYLTYENPAAFAEREWIRRLEWWPTLALLGIAVIARLAWPTKWRTDEEQPSPGHDGNLGAN